MYESLLARLARARGSLLSLFLVFFSSSCTSTPVPHSASQAVPCARPDQTWTWTWAWTKPPRRSHLQRVHRAADGGQGPSAGTLGSGSWGWQMFSRVPAGAATVEMRDGYELQRDDARVPRVTGGARQGYLGWTSVTLGGEVGITRILPSPPLCSYDSASCVGCRGSFKLFTPFRICFRLAQGRGKVSFGLQKDLERLSDAPWRCALGARAIQTCPLAPRCQCLPQPSPKESDRLHLSVADQA